MSAYAQLNSWTTCLQPNSQARLRLICFPDVGSGTAAFEAWPCGLSPQIEVCLVHFPGRESRLMQAPFTRMAALIHVLASVLLPVCDRPFAFWGNNLGALVSFELARYWYYRDLACPKHLFLANCSAPHLLQHQVQKHLLSEADFITALHSYSNIPDTLLQDPKLLKRMLPVLRADFAILETYQYRSGWALPCPISVFGNEQQTAEVTYDSLAAWEIHTQSHFKLRHLKGDRLALETQSAQILAAMNEDLANGGFGRLYPN
ncbi:MAG: thioesterase [Leptolyngbyaceae cyanobacterium SM1_1_3]|nr:thioesterase [Leptolyngbyaceae cyanobacterium SM1_1_3]NJM85536.1 thioesterase [Leptolyngbyaceae cyanobacterium RM2_2_21]NJN03742.1 thioesterase [Leptolyngbyaceae cyanobacterium RM1_1_2]NJO08539.1 thioesterase [Leptolyngbyaceae cyanobacterium SL_1_1]